MALQGPGRAAPYSQLEDLRERAVNAIEKKETLVYDVASETGQIVGNVCHMRWFRLAVMRELAASSRRYAHLVDAIPDA